jgi:hypothetical protein
MYRFNIINETGDKRYLLDCPEYELPEYDQELLNPIWDKIIDEYDKLTGDNAFQKVFSDTLSELQDWNEYIILKACYGLLQLGNEYALPILRDDYGIDCTKITPALLQQVGSMIKRKETDIAIEQQSKPEQGQKADYIKSVIELTTILTVPIDPKKITVSEYVNYNKVAKEVIAARKPKKEWAA